MGLKDKVKRIIPFKKLSRVTGYLSSGDNRVNKGKQAEFKDRVKHTCEEPKKDNE